MRSRFLSLRAIMVVAAMSVAVVAQAQVGIAQPAGDAGGVGVQPAGNDYVQPADGGDGTGDLAGFDYGDPPELSDINVRVPLTLQSLHEDVASWRMSCFVRDASGESIGGGSVSGAVESGGFSGVVFVPVELEADAAPQDVREYRCLVLLEHADGYSSHMIQDDQTDPVFRAVEGSTTFRHPFRGPDGTSRKRVVGAKADWRLD